MLCLSNNKCPLRSIHAVYMYTFCTYTIHEYFRTKFTTDATNGQRWLGSWRVMTLLRSNLWIPLFRPAVHLDANATTPTGLISLSLFTHAHTHTRVRDVMRPNMSKEYSCRIYFLPLPSPRNFPNLRNRFFSEKCGSRFPNQVEH